MSQLENKELLESLKDTFHDALEETIINIKLNNSEEFDVVNNKVDKLNQKLDKLIEVLNKLL